MAGRRRVDRSSSRQDNGDRCLWRLANWEFFRVPDDRVPRTSSCGGEKVASHQLQPWSGLASQMEPPPDHGGGLDILVSNAGRQQAHQSILEISSEDFSICLC